MATSKHFKDSGNIFDNAEPEFNTDNVHWHIEKMVSVVPEAPSQWCYKVERAIVDGKPTSHYLVCYWLNTWGLSKQHLYFADASSKHLERGNSRGRNILRKYLYYRDNLRLTLNRLDVEHFLHGRDTNDRYIRYNYVTAKYWANVQEYLKENNIPFTQTDKSVYSAILDIPHGNWIESSILVEFRVENEN